MNHPEYRPSDDTPEDDFQVYIADHSRRTQALHAVITDMLDDGIISISSPATEEADATYEIPQAMIDMDLISLFVFWYLKGFDAHAGEFS